MESIKSGLRNGHASRRSGIALRGPAGKPEFFGVIGIPNVLKNSDRRNRLPEARTRQGKNLSNVRSRYSTNLTRRSVEGNGGRGHVVT